MYGDDRSYRKCSRGEKLDVGERGGGLRIGWFQGKKCLFLIDDVWPTDGCYGALE